MGLFPGWGRSPGEGNGNLLQYSCLGNLGQRSLAGHSPWSHKELDLTEHAHTHIHVIHFYQVGKIYKMRKLPPCHPEETPIICGGGEPYFFSLLSGLQAQFPVGSYDFILASIINTEIFFFFYKNGTCFKKSQKESMHGMEREEGSGWGTHVYLWQIHFDIWQN